MRAGSVAALLITTTVLVLHAGATKAACAPPDPGALTDHRPMGFSRTRTTPLRSPGAPLRWFSVSGTAMMQGEVFVIDCRGAEQADIGLGAVEVQKPGPTVAGRPSLIIVYHSGSGTDINLQHVALLQYRNHMIERLWDHSSFDGEYPPKSLGHKEQTIYRWRFTSDARRIEVTGRDVVYRDQETNDALHMKVRRIRRLEPEHFCLNLNRMKYLPCR